MMSRIEQLISEIEEYIDSCKFQALSVYRMRLRSTRKSSASRIPFLEKPRPRQMPCWRTPRNRLIP